MPERQRRTETPLGMTPGIARFCAGFGPLITAAAVVLPRPLGAFAFLGATITSCAFYFLFGTLARLEKEVADRKALTPEPEAVSL